MGDTNHGADVDTSNADNNAGGGSANETVDDADTTQNTDAKDGADDAGSDAGDQSGSDDGADDNGKGDSDKETDTADDDDAEEFEDDGSEPELRKPKQGASNAEWAAWRAQEKAKKQNGKDDADKSGDDTKGDDVDDEDEDGLSPEDRAALDKRIAKHMAPFQKQAAEQEVEASIATFVKDNPDFAPFAAKAKRFALHPSRENIPIKSIFYEVAGDKLMAIGAKRAKAADAKAKKTQTGGGTTGNEGGGSKSYKDMPLDDFGKELEAVKLGRG